MSERWEKLTVLGCDRESTMDRFLDDEDFYDECYDKVMSDPNFLQLGEALKNHEVTEAFECAHSLKGVVSNLGLCSLSKKIEQIVEPLRNGSDAGLTEKYQEMMRERERYLLL